MTAAAAGGQRVGINKPPLLVLGVHSDSEAYPNTRYRLRELAEAYQVRTIQSQAWGDVIGAARAARRPWRILGAHLSILRRYLAGPRPALAYVPYPAVFVLVLMSLLPRQWRPRRIVADAFISLYDTAVRDRAMAPPTSWRARLLHHLERRAYSIADAVVVDTSQNASFYAELFRLPASLFRPVPLSTNERDYLPVPYRPDLDGCEVLFVGTLVPLHGVPVILEAAKRLAHRSDIHFRIIGDGLGASVVDAALEGGLPNVIWERDWRSPDDLAAAIAMADICLGVFGDGAKAQRVCPYKVYAYMAVGRAVISGDTEWARAITTPGCESLVRVPTGDPGALADAIMGLSDDVQRRVQLANAARAYYETMLSNERAHAMLMEILAEGDQ